MSEEKTCKNCGKPIENDWTVCPNCSSKIITEEKKTTETRCIACGEIIEKDYNICPHCGKENNISEKKGTTCLILCVILGRIFLHRFYVGKTLSAKILCLFFILGSILRYANNHNTLAIILFIFTSFITTIISLVDFIQLINEKFTDSNGKYVKIDEEIQNKKCKSCGKFIENDCLICPYCKTENNDIFSEKNGIIYLAILIFLGLPFLIHRFYIGKVKSALILLIPAIISGIVVSIIFILFDIIDFSKIIFSIAIIISIYISEIIVWINDLIQFFKGEAHDSKGKYIGIIKKVRSELK